MLKCHNGHTLEATIKIDATATNGAARLEYGDVDVYCAEDCQDIPAEIVEAALVYFKGGHKDAWDYPPCTERDALVLVRLRDDQTPVANAPCEHEDGTDVCPEHGPHNADYCPACSLRQAMNDVANAIDVADDSVLTPEELREKAHELREAVRTALGAA